MFSKTIVVHNGRIFVRDSRYQSPGRKNNCVCIAFAKYGGEEHEIRLSLCNPCKDKCEENRLAYASGLKPRAQHKRGSKSKRPKSKIK